MMLKFGFGPKLWDYTFPWLLVAYVFYKIRQLRIRSSKYLRNRFPAAKISDPVITKLTWSYIIAHFFPKVFKKHDSLTQGRSKNGTHSSNFISFDKTTEKTAKETLLIVRTNYNFNGTCVGTIPRRCWVLKVITLKVVGSPEITSEGSPLARCMAWNPHRSLGEHSS